MCLSSKETYKPSNLFCYWLALDIDLVFREDSVLFAIIKLVDIFVEYNRNLRLALKGEKRDVNKDGS